MYSFLFKNRLGALAFVVLTVIGAMELVGTEDEDGMIERTAAQFQGQQTEFDQAASILNAPPAPPRPVVAAPPFEGSNTDFAADDSLIDSAEGYDPTPPDNLAYDGEIVSERYDSGPSPIVIEGSGPMILTDDSEEE